VIPRLLIGWKAISSFLGCSERKCIGLKEELQDYGVLFYTRVGCPWRRRPAAWTDRLQKWTMVKAQNRETV